MKVKVFQSKENKYLDMKVLDQYRYVGPSDELEFINGKIYNCVGYEDGMARIVDETGEDYLYYLDNFEKIKPLTLLDKWRIDDEILDELDSINKGESNEEIIK